MAITEDNTLVLAEVPKLTRQASSNANLIIEENKEIKRYNLDTYIMNFIEENSRAIGHPTVDNDGNEVLPDGILKNIEELGEDIATINTAISDNDNGLQKQINDLKASTSELKTKKTLEGYRVQFIENTDNINLLSKTTTLTYTFNNINGLKLIDCIKNNSKYCANLYFDITYELDNSKPLYVDGTIHTNAVINLNSSTRNNPEKKQIALFLPLANAVIVLQTSISGNNLTITVKDTKSIDSLKPNTGVIINYGELEIKSNIDIIDNVSSDGSSDGSQPSEPEEITMIPLTLCFDIRDLYATGKGNAANMNTNTKMMYGSKIKFDISDIGEKCENIHLKVKYQGNTHTHEGEELVYNVGKLGNEITLKDVHDSIPVPKIVYYESIYSDFGITPGMWFKYYTFVNNNVVNPAGSVVELLFDNYNYNGTNHKIEYVQTTLTDFEGNAVTNSNPHPLTEQEGRIDSFCIPMSQWKAFFASYDKYEFILNCKVAGSTEVKRLTGYTMNDDNSPIINMYWEDTDGSKQVLLRAINYENNTSATGPNGRRTGIYLRGDMESFSIEVRIKEETPDSGSGTAGDGGT